MVLTAALAATTAAALKGAVVGAIISLGAQKMIHNPDIQAAATHAKQRLEAGVDRTQVLHDFTEDFKVATERAAADTLVTLSSRFKRTAKRIEDKRNGQLPS